MLRTTPKLEPNRDENGRAILSDEEEALLDSVKAMNLPPEYVGETINTLLDYLLITTLSHEPVSK